MIKVFNSPFKVTQKFGVNPYIYKKYGLKGHEGLDLIPTTSDWAVYSLPFKSIIVKDIDMKKKGGHYGIFTTAWYPDISEAWMYCHFSSNNTYKGQELPPTFKLGQMGATGNTTGAHVHINRFKVDERGYRLNKNNGYLGGIDPLPFLQKEIGIEPTKQEDKHKTAGIVLLDEYRNNRRAGPEGNWESYTKALVRSDQQLVELIAKVAGYDREIEALVNEYQEKIRVIKQEAKKSCEAEKLISDVVWQKRLKSASIDTLKNSDYSVLLNALIAKLFRKRGEKDGSK